MEIVSLIGFMGSGKSSVAKFLSKTMNINAVDLDRYIENSEKMKISEIFALKGEQYFRQAESEALKSLIFRKNLILSCGGGIILKEENIDLLRNHSEVFFLSARGETIFERVKNSDRRPLLKGNMNVQYIEQMQNCRDEKYRRCAHYTIDVNGKSVESIGKEIAEIIKNGAKI